MELGITAKEAVSEFSKEVIIIHEGDKVLDGTISRVSIHTVTVKTDKGDTTIQTQFIEDGEPTWIGKLALREVGQ